MAPRPARPWESPPPPTVSTAPSLHPSLHAHDASLTFGHANLELQKQGWSLSTTPPRTRMRLCKAVRLRYRKADQTARRRSVHMDHDQSPWGVAQHLQLVLFWWGQVRHLIGSACWRGALASSAAGASAKRPWSPVLRMCRFLSSSPKAVAICLRDTQVNLRKCWATKGWPRSGCG